MRLDGPMYLACGSQPKATRRKLHFNGVDVVGFTNNSESVLLIMAHITSLRFLHNCANLPVWNNSNAMHCQGNAFTLCHVDLVVFAELQLCDQGLVGLRRQPLWYRPPERTSGCTLFPHHQGLRRTVVCTRTYIVRWEPLLFSNQVCFNFQPFFSMMFLTSSEIL